MTSVSLQIEWRWDSNDKTKMNWCKKLSSRISLPVLLLPLRHPYLSRTWIPVARSSLPLHSFMRTRNQSKVSTYNYQPSHRKDEVWCPYFDARYFHYRYITRIVVVIGIVLHFLASVRNRLVQVLITVAIEKEAFVIVQCSYQFIYILCITAVESQRLKKILRLEVKDAVSYTLQLVYTWSPRP
jgi:hypothetical protein